MLFKGKKGDVGGSMQQILFYATEFVLGALIIVAGISIVSSQAQDSSAKSVANDLGLIISTISYSNIDVFFAYPVSTDIVGLSITFDDRKNKYLLSVFSKKGKSHLYLDTASGINLEPASFVNPKFIPFFLNKNENVLKFDDIKFDECSNKALFPRGTKFRLSVPHGYGMSEVERNVLFDIKTKLEFMDSKKVYFDSSSNLIIDFVFYDESFVNISSNIPESEAFGCYLKKYLYDLKLEVNTDTNINDKIIISLGNYDEFLRKIKSNNVDLEDLYSIFIFNSFKKGVISI